MTNKTQVIGFGTTHVKKKVPIPDSINFKTGALIKIMPTLKDQIDYLHQMIGNKEWSGILFYLVKKGNINNIDKVTIEAWYIMPLNIGSAIFTEYDPDEAALDAFEMFKGVEDMERGTIHTHHNMAAFFSSTDTEDLLEKVADGSHSYYLSLIVNVQETYVAKIAVMSDNSFTEYSVNIGGKKHPVKIPSIKKTALTFEADVKLPPGKEMPLPFRTQVEKIITAAKVNTATPRNGNRTAHYYNDYYDTEAYSKSVQRKARTEAIPGMGKAKEEKKEKKVVSKLSLRAAVGKLESFIDIITVGHEFGSIQEVINCETSEELMNVIADSIEFYSGKDKNNEGQDQYHEQLKEYIISSLFETETIVTAITLREVIDGMLEIMITMPECKRKPTEKLVLATKIILANMRTNSLDTLRQYEKTVTKV